jgi:hypothetical protein
LYTAMKMARKEKERAAMWEDDCPDAEEDLASA